MDVHDDEDLHPRDPDLLRLLALRRQARGQEDLHLVLAKRVDEREAASGLRDRINATWAELRPFPPELRHALLDLESALGERCSIVEDVAFDLGYRLGLVEARLEQEELDPGVGDLAAVVGDVIADAGLPDEVSVEALAAVLRVVARKSRRRDTDG